MLLKIVCVLQVVLAQHVWNLFTANQQASCQLSNVYEESASFVDVQNNSLTGFVTNDDYFKFGLILSPNATFNMIYALACAPTNCFVKRFYIHASTCPRTVFIIGASGPASPIIDILNYDLAVGAWQISNNQILLQISFP
jgi:hypothetical protein